MKQREESSAQGMNRQRVFVMPVAIVRMKNVVMVWVAVGRRAIMAMSIFAVRKEQQSVQKKEIVSVYRMDLRGSVVAMLVKSVPQRKESRCVHGMEDVSVCQADIVRSVMITTVKPVRQRKEQQRVMMRVVGVNKRYSKHH